MIGENTVDLKQTNHLCVVIGIAKADSSGSVIYCLNLGKDDCIEGHPFKLHQKNGLYIWPNERIDTAKISHRSILRYQVFGDISTYLGNTKRYKDVDQIQMELDYGESVFKSIKEVHPDAVWGKQKGIYLERKPEKDATFLLSLKSAVIKNERIYFQSREDALDIDLKLNCREHLTLSTTPVTLMIRKVTDEDDVGDLALIKFGTTDVCLRHPIYPAVCEALILKFKPKVISADEEPVKIENGEGQIILVPGNVKFDTGNDGGTAISHDLMEELGLEPDRSKKFFMTGIGGNIVECFTVKIRLCIRKHWIIVSALVGAVAPRTDLLIGNDIISYLDKKSFSIGQ